MSRVHLHHWDAVELFCYLVATYERLDIGIFKDNEVLVDFVGKYSTDPHVYELTEAIFGKKQIIAPKAEIDEKGKVKKANEIKSISARRKTVYELTKMIRFEEPVVLPEKTFKNYLDFINKEREEKINIHKTSLKRWEPSKKMRAFENTQWALYYYDEESDKSDGPDIEMIGGVTRALLRLKPFGKAEIRGYRTTKKDSEIYNGYYSMYGEKYMLLEMKLGEYREKDLHILFYIGTGSLTLAIGQFHNVGASIYSGTVILEKFTSKSVPAYEDADAGTFFPSDHIDLPKHISEFFRDKRRNILRVPSNITSISDFWLWHTKKNASKGK